MKKFSIILLFGFLLGAALAGFLSPSMISWYFDPPASIGVSCKEAVVWGIGSYQKLVVIGGLCGGLIAGITFVVVQMKKQSPLPPV